MGADLLAVCCSEFANMGPAHSKKASSVPSVPVEEKHAELRQREAYIALPDWAPLLSLLSTLPPPTNPTSFEHVLSELVFLNQNVSEKAFSSAVNSSDPSASASGTAITAVIVTDTTDRHTNNEDTTVSGTISSNNTTTSTATIAPNEATAEKKDRFNVLRKFLETELSEEEHKEFFQVTLPFILKLAPLIQDEKLFPVQVSAGGVRRCTLLPRSYHQQPISIIISKLHAAILLANGFLCLFPDDWICHSTFSQFPDFNFRPLFAGLKAPQEAAKLKCFLHYFNRVHEATDNLSSSAIVAATAALTTVLATSAAAATSTSSVLVFQRRVLNKFPNWASLHIPLKDINVRESGVIEDSHNALQVDFANRRIGGGVLSGGCVQEEIRFSIEPELLCACLFFEALDPNESIVIWGTERYSSYKGYAFTLKYGGDYRQTSEQAVSALTCIDACDYRGIGALAQYEPATMLRELSKAFVGFEGPDPSVDLDQIPQLSLTFATSSPKLASTAVSLRRPIATGHWGCGAFLGCKEHKVILQWLAASACDRDMIFFTFAEKFEFTPKLQKLAQECQQRQITVSNVWLLLVQYGALVTKEKLKMNKNAGADGTGVFDFLFTQLGITLPSEKTKNVF